MSLKFKIGVWILSDYKPQTGGGFSLYDKIIQLIDDHNFSNDVEVCFVGHGTKSNYNFKKEYLSVYPFPLNISFINKLVTKYSHKFGFIGNLEGRILKNNDVGLIYYPVQGYKKIKNFPFVSANWDIGHKSNFAFPEVAMNNRFEFREKWYSKEIFKALMVFAESEEGKKELISYTKLNADRIGIVPLFAGGVVDLNINQSEQQGHLSKLNLEAGKYYFYPAQFWAHKNHYNLLLAFKEIVKASPDIKLVLTGSDKGNKKYIKELSGELGLERNVIFTGFLSNEEVFTLYKNALALVMTSFSGTTNMPLIEARTLGCPVICSDLKGHIEILKDGAYYFSAIDHESLINAMKRIMNVEEKSELLKRAKESMRDTIFTPDNAIRALEENFKKLKSLRLCWGKSDKIF